MIFLGFIYLLSITVWIGSIIFFSFFTAPILFKTLDREKAGKVIEVILPKYYLIGYICSILSSTALGIRLQSIQDWRLGILLIMATCSVIAGQGVGPKARTITDQIRKLGGSENNPELKAKFDKLHSLSVRLNGITLILGLAMLCSTAGNLRLN